VLPRVSRRLKAAALHGLFSGPATPLSDRGKQAAKTCLPMPDILQGQVLPIRHRCAVF
jgi:hypothetical protein